ncbi:MAG: MBL fold metallo-hydrolase [Cyclobacteriaceae bacterium]
MLKQLTLLLIIVSLSSTNTLAQDFSKITISDTKITDDIYYLKGAGGNIGLLKWEGGNLIVDSQFEPLGDKIKAKIAEISEGKTKYLVNTHFHGDHLGGNANWSADGVTVVAQENVRTRVQKNFRNEILKRDVKAQPVEVWPVITFSENMSLFVGDEEVNVIFIPEAHTDGDAIIQFKTSNVIHTGDVFVRYGYPFIDVSAGGSINGIIAGLEKIMDLADEETRIIPGHGDLATREDVKVLHSVLSDSRNLVKKLKEEGKSLNDVLTLKPLAKYDEQYSGSFINGQTFIQLVYASL